jgi:gluconate 2-dehydrogenase alpha chain
MGWTGSILSRELTKTGLHVVGLERGAMRTPREDFTIPSIRDELKYSSRHELFQDTALETVTLRHNTRETALPIRRLGSFLPGMNVGGAGSHWNGATWRRLEADYVVRSHYTQKYGRNVIPADMTVQDFGVSFAEMEPFYDKFEKLCGISGQAGNLRGQKIAGGNVFEGPRANQYPNKPLARNLAAAFGQCERGLYQPRRRDHGPVRLLRILRTLWLRIERESIAQCEYSSRAAARSALRTAHACLCEKAQL